MSGARRIADAAREVAQTVFRMAPWPTEPGLRRIGDPGPNSPVLVTCNYDLTVRRLTRALRGVDAWLVVAPSAGINVWCAASGGHFGTHQVVTALKTSGVAERVAHRRAILPQLAATGVERREVKRRCGWNARFGPVRAEDIPRYLAADGRKDDAMRRVHFGVRERIEMALAWGGPAALLLVAGALFLAPAFAPGLAALALALSGLVFLAYEPLPEPRRPVFVGLAVLGALLAVGLAGGGAAALTTAALASAGCALLLTFDRAGSTPTEGGSHFEEARWRVVLDRERCKGVYSCWEVCPEACFDKPPEEPESDHPLAAGGRGRTPIALAREDRCIRCGACVVQCPLDALAFEADDGRRIEPATIRRFKLGLLGRRSREAGGLC